MPQACAVTRKLDESQGNCRDRSSATALAGPVSGVAATSASAAPASSKQSIQQPQPSGEDPGCAVEVPVPQGTKYSQWYAKQYMEIRTAGARINSGQSSICGPGPVGTTRVPMAPQVHTASRSHCRAERWRATVRTLARTRDPNPWGLSYIKGPLRFAEQGLGASAHITGTNHSSL